MVISILFRSFEWLLTSLFGLSIMMFGTSVDCKRSITVFIIVVIGVLIFLSESVCTRCFTAVPSSIGFLAVRVVVWGHAP